MKQQNWQQLRETMARRTFLTGVGSLGAVAMAELAGGSRLLAQAPPTRRGIAIKSYGTMKEVDFAPRAKRVIRIHMVGAVSQVDTFDYKPMLEKMHGQELPPSIRAKGRLSTM